MRVRSLAIFVPCLAIRLLAASSPISVRVDASVQTSRHIPRTIFGTFLEPIGQSIYGGLWAEILSNPSFEENLWNADQMDKLIADEPALRHASGLGLPLPWQPLDPKEGNRYEPRWGDAANSWRSLAIMGRPGSPTGVKQKVFLPVSRELTYKGSIFAKHIGGPTSIRVSLRSRAGGNTTLAESHIDAAAEQWRKYVFQLQLRPNAAKPLAPLDFAIEVEGDERVQVDQASLMPADAIHGFDPEEVRLAKDLHTPLLRFGGNFTSAYHWRDGVSNDPDKRVSMLNIAWGMPEYNTFGTDEFLDFCKLIDAGPQIALNLGSGSPGEAADWVKYVNDRWPNHEGLLWELGNELWGNWNLGNPTLGELAARTSAFSKAVRAVDPKARLIATGQDPDHFQEWNATELTTPPDTFQFLSTHFVVTTDEAVTAHPSKDGLASATYALPVELGRKLDAMQEQINASNHRAQIAFTEYLFLCCDRNQLPSPSYRNMGGAIAIGGFLNMLMTHAAVVPIADMTGLMEFTGIWKKRGQVYVAPSYYAFSLYSTADVDHLVKAEGNVGFYGIREGISRLPNIDHVPYLDVVAAANEQSSRLTLFAVNRQLSGDSIVNITLANFRASGVAHVKLLTAADRYTENTEEAPNKVRPLDSTVAVQSGELSIRVPHESVARVEIDRHTP